MTTICHFVKTPRFARLEVPRQLAGRTAFSVAPYAGFFLWYLKCVPFDLDRLTVFFFCPFARSLSLSNGGVPLFFPPRSFPWFSIKADFTAGARFPPGRVFFPLFFFT